MVTEKEVEHIAELADIGIEKDEVRQFTTQFNAILDYFDVLDQVRGDTGATCPQYNVFREDEVTPPIPPEEVLSNAGATEDGYFRAPKVM